MLFLQKKEMTSYCWSLPLWCYRVLPVHLVMVFSPLVSWKTMKELGSRRSPSSPLNMRSNGQDTQPVSSMTTAQRWSYSSEYFTSMDLTFLRSAFLICCAEPGTSFQEDSEYVLTSLPRNVFMVQMYLCVRVH